MLRRSLTLDMHLTWWSSFAELDGISVFHVDLAEDPAREKQAYFLLDVEERARARRFHSQKARRQFMLCRAALRAKLCDYLGCEHGDLRISLERNEKPQGFVCDRPTNLQFNLSHTNGHGLIVVAQQGRVGVDIENRNFRHNPEGEIRMVFSPTERSILKRTESCRKVEVFLRLWTMKESVIKATGEGFRADTTAFTVPECLIHGGRRSKARFESIPSVQWELFNLENESFVAAVAHEVVE